MGARVVRRVIKEWVQGAAAQVGERWRAWSVRLLEGQAMAAPLAAAVAVLGTVARGMAVVEVGPAAEAAVAAAARLVMRRSTANTTGGPPLRTSTPSMPIGTDQWRRSTL